MKHYIFIVLLLCSIKLHSQLFGGAMVNSPKETVTFTYKGQTVTYGVVRSSTGRKWLDRNLGASQVATSSTDVAGYGDMFQWGRLDDGHQNRNSSTTSTLSSTDVPGNNLFITNSSSPLTDPIDWRSPQNNNLWQGLSGTNNPCPTGFRIPTFNEFYLESLTWSSNNAAGAIASPLKLPMAGYRDAAVGSYVGTEGNSASYWNSDTFSYDQVKFYSYASTFSSNNSVSGSLTRRANGSSVRCIKD